MLYHAHHTILLQRLVYSNDPSFVWQEHHFPRFQVVSAGAWWVLLELHFNSRGSGCGCGSGRISLDVDGILDEFD